jgi:hypothetical protein
MCDMLNADRSFLARADDSSAAKFVQQRPLPCAEKGLTGVCIHTYIMYREGEMRRRQSLALR